LSGGSSDFIFHKVTPSVVYAAPTITFTLADNWFSVNGFPIKIDGSAPTATPLGAPMKYAIYFVLSEDTTSDIRDWQSLVGTTITTNRSSIVIRDTKASRVEITEGFPVPAPPALGAGDIGSVLYATTEWDGAALVGTVLGTNFWSFPGDIAVAAAHAVTHLPGGADEVNAAALTGAGSTGGLMPVDSLDVLMNAVQDLAINVSSQYVTVSVAGDNVSAPKTATLGMRLYDSLAVVDDVGVKKLGLGFQVGAFDGTSVYPARQDHIHSSTNTPFFMDVYTYDIAATLVS